MLSPSFTISLDYSDVSHASHDLSVTFLKEAAEVHELVMREYNTFRDYCDENFAGNINERPSCM